MRNVKMTTADDQGSKQQLLQMTDGSPFDIKQKWETVWGTDLPREYFSPISQQIIKTVLSVIVAARCGGTYPYVISGMLVIFCVLKDRAPKLILPWIFVSGIKSLCMTFLEALTGVYVCSAFGKIHKACIEFFISKALEIIFAAYLWGSVLSIYHDMERRLENKKILENPEISYIKKMDFKRQRARSLLDESTLYKTACLNNFEFKDVPQIILQMLRRADEMSQDSLLGPGMMLASVSNMGSFDNLKTSESLGELECTNLQSTKVIGLDEEENLSPAEKALKFLKMTWSDVRRVQKTDVSLQTDVFAINSDIWFHVTESDPRIFKPKQARTEVFIRELPELELEEDRVFKRRNVKNFYDIKLGVSLFNLIKKNELDDNEDEGSFIDSQEETEEEEEEEEEENDDSEVSQIFMSNIKEERPVNRIGLNIAPKQIKGKAYYKLYRKDFMSVIGPEVFDRATKLPKVTSFTVMNLHTEEIPPKRSKTTSLQEETSESALSEDSTAPRAEADDQFSIHDSNIITRNSIDSLTDKTTVEDSTEEENQPEAEESEFKTEATPSQKSVCNRNGDEYPNLPSPPSSPRMKGAIVKKSRPPCYRKRRIRIKWIGKLKENNLIECLSTHSSFSNNSDGSSEFQHTPESDSDKDNSDSHHTTRTPPSYSNSSSDKSDNNSAKFSQDREIYFLTELLHKPLPEVLRKYYDLKNMVYTRRRRSSMSQKQLEYTNKLYRMYYLKRFGEMCDFSMKRNKIWKSEVLKTAEAHQQPITGEFSNILDHDIVNKLLKYHYLYLMSKMKERNNDANLMSFFQADDKKLKILDNKDQSSTVSTSSKPRNELCCRSRSENLFQSHIILTEANDDTAHSNKRTFNETPSERSIEVYHKDLTNGEIYNSEKLPSSLEGCLNGNGFKTAAGKSEFCEDTEDDSLCSEESDEPISLYYSKAANLASPLLDMKKFIYPDHIHYSYKHVNKRGFDINISGGFPLLVQSQALTTNNSLQVEEISANPESKITRRPMDLSFAKTDAFAEWQNSDQNVSDCPMQSNKTSKRTKAVASGEDIDKRKKGKSGKKKSGTDGETNLPNTQSKTEKRTTLNAHHVYFTQNYVLCERLKKKPSELIRKEQEDEEERAPLQISSTQLHSNKGRISSTYNPALRLQENKKEEKKKVETREKRTKDMLARLEREILFQNKNGFTSSKP